MTGSYSVTLVVLSVVIAFLASCTGLKLARRVRHCTGLAATIWLFGGAVSMGIGIWSMHFVGILAYGKGMALAFDVPTTIFSLFVAVGASAFAIDVGSRAQVSNIKILLSGVILGLGIACMHYSGMHAMRLQGQIHYDFVWVVFSIAVAIIAATVALWISFAGKTGNGRSATQRKTAAAVILSIAICGMHYIGMLALTFETIGITGLAGTDPQQNSWLAASLGIGAMVILGVTHLTIFFDNRLAEERLVGEKAERKAIQLGEILDDASNEIYVFTVDTLEFLKVNRGAVENLGYSHDQLLTLTPVDLKPEYDRESFLEKLEPLRNGAKKQIDFKTLHIREDGTTYPVQVHLQLSNALTEPVYVAIIVDVTERNKLEEQIAQSRKLESIGQLAAGIAHEINTPAQYVNDNTRFLQDAFEDLLRLLKAYDALFTAANDKSIDESVMADVVSAREDADPEYLIEEIPSAISQSLDGIKRVSKIVRAMKEFSHPGSEEKEMVDLQKNISNTIIVASNEWKYLAKLVTEFDDSLALVPCHPQEISQVVLNLIVNASHAIAERFGDSGDIQGEISISTKQTDGFAEIRICDNGGGMPKSVQERVFDPFYTTKEVGKGTGQGLSMAFATIVDKHGGSIQLESEPGVGTTFEIRIPLSIEQKEFKDKAA